MWLQMHSFDSKAPAAPRLDMYWLGAMQNTVQVKGCVDPLLARPWCNEHLADSIRRIYPTLQPPHSHYAPISRAELVAAIPDTQTKRSTGHLLDNAELHAKRNRSRDVADAAPNRCCPRCVIGLATPACNHPPQDMEQSNGPGMGTPRHRNCISNLLPCLCQSKLPRSVLQVDGQQPQSWFLGEMNAELHATCCCCDPD